MMVHFWNSVKNMACLSISLVLILLAHASLPPSFWHNSLQMETYLLNILQSKLLENKSPLEILYEREPFYSHLRVFGCLCYPLFPSPTINKLQPGSTPCVFLGFPPNHRGYKFYDLSSRKIIICRHVIFYENSFAFEKLHTPSYPQCNILDSGLNYYVIEHFRNSNVASNDPPHPTAHSPAQSTPPSSPFPSKLNPLLSLLNIPNFPKVHPPLTARHLIPHSILPFVPNRFHTIKQFSTTSHSNSSPAAKSCDP